MTAPPAADEPVVRHADVFLRVAENVLYALAGVVLAAGASVTLVAVAYRLANDLRDGTQLAVGEALDGLLLIFILLELLAAVRATMLERALVAEPFLIVGIIASIKELVVAALVAKDALGKEPDRFEDALTGVGVLAGVTLVLALATFLVRRKEREPAE